MRFVDYSIPNGDRDDEEDEIPLKEESVPSPTHKTSKLVVKQISKSARKGMVVNLVGIQIPRAFDFDYYDNKIEEAKAKLDKTQAYRIQAFKKYAEVVYEFYRQVAYLTNKTNNIIEMPDYIKNCEKHPCNIDNLADVLYNREQALIKAYNMQEGKLQTAFSRSKHFQEVKEFAASGWLLYYNLKNLNNFVGYLRYIQDCYASADLTKISHKANIYGLHIQANYYLDANIKNFYKPNFEGFFFRKRPKSVAIYQNLNSSACFDYLTKQLNGYVASEHEDVLKYKHDMPENSTEKRIVGFYDCYADMKYVKHQLRRIYKSSDKTSDIFLFSDRYTDVPNYIGRDLYIAGANYYLACESLLSEISQKSKIYRDVSNMYDELGEALVNIEDLYNKLKQEGKEV